MSTTVLSKWVWVAVLAFVLAPAAGAGELDREKLDKQLRKHEAKRTKMYKDTEGVPTIGVGFNLKRPDAKEKIEKLGLNFDKVLAGEQELSDKQIDQLLKDDIDAAIADCKKVFPNFAGLSDVRQRVLVDMMFNLGKPRLEKFKKMIANVNKGDFAKAADEMKDSKWYTQVKKRGRVLEQMMRTDSDPR
jgi:GH24 family phage-related lysozyme (muramidase)